MCSHWSFTLFDRYRWCLNLTVLSLSKNFSLNKGFYLQFLKPPCFFTLPNPTFFFPPLSQKILMTNQEDSGKYDSPLNKEAFHRKIFGEKSELLKQKYWYWPMDITLLCHQSFSVANQEKFLRELIKDLSHCKSQSTP